MKKVIVIAMLSIAVTACGPTVVATRPVEPVVVIPPSPGPGYVWVNGAWRWDRRARVHRYVDGYWVRPARPGAAYVPGHWHETRGGWRYTRGHWR